MDIEDRGISDNEKSAEGNHKCGRCGATGRFITYMENGKLKGPGGPCYRCSGKGYHNRRDRVRNEYFDTHQVVHLS